MPFNTAKLLSRRIPLIKFTHGGNKTTLETTIQQKETHKPATQQAKELNQTSNIIEFFQIPSKYARRLLTNEEIDSVNVSLYIPRYNFNSILYNFFFKHGGSY